MNDDAGHETINVRYFQFQRGHHTFRVLEVPDPQEIDGVNERYIGYCGEIKSVASDSFNTCVRGLIRKHITGLKRGEVVKFANAQEKAWKRETGQ